MPDFEFVHLQDVFFDTKTSCLPGRQGNSLPRNSTGFLQKGKVRIVKHETENMK